MFIVATYTLGSGICGGTNSGAMSFKRPLRDQIISVFTDALKMVWYVALVPSGIAFFLAFGERQIKLRVELDTEFGLQEKEKGKRFEDGVALE